MTHASGPASLTPIERAAQILMQGRQEAAGLPVAEAARLAHHAGGPSVAELERRILARRAGDG